MKTSHSAGYFKHLILLLLLSLMTIFVFSANALALTGNHIDRCSDCHGDRATNDVRPIDSAYKNITTGGFPGNHRTHMGPGSTEAACDICHVPQGFGHRDGKISFIQSINGSPNPNTNTYTKAGTALFVNQTSVPIWNNASCSTANCHFETLAATWNQNAAQAGMTCNSCHNGFTSPAPHDKHTNSNTYKYGCDKCHSTYTTFQHATSAGNPGRGIAINTDKNYSGSNYKYLPSQAADRTLGSCANLYCHSNGQSPAVFATIKWDASLPADCTGCHGNEANSTTLSGAHSSHLAKASEGGAFACADCHRQTITNTNNRSIADFTKHVNVQLNYSGIYAGRYTAQTKTCSALYCHSNGRNGGAPNKPIPAWNSGGTLNCDGCHGAETDLASGNHGAHLRNGTTNAACLNCHWNTTQGVGSIANVGQHINRSVGIAKGGSFNNLAVDFSGTTTCSNISCHSSGKFVGGNATWGQALGCDGCHPLNNLSAAHKTHAGQLNLATQVTFYSYTANKSTGAESATVMYGFGCANCHPAAETGMHVNGSVEVALAPVDNAGSIRQMNQNATKTVFGTYNNDKTCDIVYCHSDGKPTMAVGGNGHSPAWNTTFAAMGGDRCGKCHGNTPTDVTHATHVAGGIHSDDIFSGSVGKLSPGSTGSVSHGISGQVTTISCNICHNATVTTARNEGNSSCTGCHTVKTNASIAGLGKHINGKVDIFFAITTIHSKAQLRDESFIGYTSGAAGWKRNGGYKNGAASFDSSKNKLGAQATFAPGAQPGTGSCANVVCHNMKAGQAPVTWNSTLTCDSCHISLN